MTWVIDAKKAKGTYELFLEFNDGLKGFVDLKEILKNDHRAIIRELLDVKIFNNFVIENDTVCWHNGVDFAPEFLYEMTDKYRQVA